MMEGNRKIITLWREEYQRRGIPSFFREDPSGSVVEFMHFLEARGVRAGRAIDVGCGSGRNALFLAESGFEVYAVDFVPELIRKLNGRSHVLGVSSRVRAYCQSVTDPWPFPSNHFGLAIDTFCYKHQISESGKERYRRELARSLKRGGFYLLTLAGTDDGYYGSLLATSGDATRRVIVDPANGIASILYDKQDIEREFGPSFDCVWYGHKIREGMMHGNHYTRSTHMFIFVRR